MPQQNENANASDILAHVLLESFNANPTTIGPFGTSVISLSVTGPIGEFDIKLNGQDVAESDEQVVQPSSTTTYRLTATAGGVSKLLGSLQVMVDTSTCQINPINNPAATVLQPVFANITGDLSFRAPAVATFSPGLVHLQLRLSKKVNDFPDPDVDIDLSFGLAVHDVGLLVSKRVLEATDEQISVDISFPAWVWLIPGAFIGLGIAIDDGKRDAKKQMHELIQGIVALLNFHLTAPDGFRMQSVRVDVDSNGFGIIETTQCPFAIVHQ